MSEHHPCSTASDRSSTAGDAWAGGGHRIPAAKLELMINAISLFSVGRLWERVAEDPATGGATRGAGAHHRQSRVLVGTACVSVQKSEICEFLLK